MLSGGFQAKDCGIFCTPILDSVCGWWLTATTVADMDHTVEGH
jgi:hypothetical protein